jgi:Xaa-Pro dipeptidase
MTTQLELTAATPAPASCDPARPVPRAVLEARLTSLQAWMAQQGLQALVVFGHGSALAMATRSHGNLRYLLDWDAEYAQSALVLPSHGAPALAVGNIFSVMRAREQGWMTVRFGKGPGLAKEIVALLPAGATRIGIVGREEIPMAVWDVLAAAGASGWVDCSSELARRRATKDPVEIAYHREAGRICDEIFDRLGPALHSGKAVFQIQAELEHHARSRGCELCKTWLTVAPVPDRCRYSRDENYNVPQEGDQVLLGIMLILHGHWGHAIRTGAIGRASAAAERIFARVEAMHTAMFESLRPNTDISVVGDAGVVPAEKGLFQFRSGHALGHSYEDPAGTSEFPQPYEGVRLSAKPAVVQAGMVFELHPNLFIENVGAASIGDMVLVTDHGAEYLTKFPRHLLIF